MSELKECPFCNADEVQRREFSAFSGHSGECKCCGALGPISRDIERARILWDTRPEEDRLRAENKELVKALSDVVAYLRETAHHNAPQAVAARVTISKHTGEQQ